MTNSSLHMSMGSQLNAMIMPSISSILGFSLTQGIILKSKSEYLLMIHASFQTSVTKDSHAWLEE